MLGRKISPPASFHRLTPKSLVFNQLSDYPPPASFSSRTTSSTSRSKIGKKALFAGKIFSIATAEPEPPEEQTSETETVTYTENDLQRTVSIVAVESVSSKDGSKTRVTYKYKWDDEDQDPSEDDEVVPPAAPVPWCPRGDSLDSAIMKLWLPALLNFLLFPLVGAVDIFWVGRMGIPASLAAQGASDRIFSSTFWIITFLPSLVAPLVAKAAASGDVEAVQRQIGQAVFLSVIIGMFGMLLLTQFPTHALSIVGVLPNTEVFSHAKPYIIIRSLSFIPAIISTVAFAAFRGTMDTLTPLKVTLCCQLLNVLLDPVLIFGLGPFAALGAAGAAMATVGAELSTFAAYLYLMLKRKMVRWKYMWRAPAWTSLRPLLVGGAAVQLRAVSLNVALICAMRYTLNMDANGVYAAAHTLTINLWQLGGIVLLSLGSIASIMVAQAVNKTAANGGGRVVAKQQADRLLTWGLGMGLLLGCLQAGALPLLQVFSPVAQVQEAARAPSIIAAATQVLNGVVFVGEGIMQGHEDFGRLALLMMLASGGLLCGLYFWGTSLVGVWCSFLVFAAIRLVGCLYHHFNLGPLSASRIHQTALKTE